MVILFEKDKLKYARMAFPIKINCFDFSWHDADRVADLSIVANFMEISLQTATFDGIDAAVCILKRIPDGENVCREMVWYCDKRRR